VIRAVVALAAMTVAACSGSNAVTPLPREGREVVVPDADGEPVAWRPEAPSDWLPTGDGVFMDDLWWALVAPAQLDDRPAPPLGSFGYGDVVATSEADVDGNGTTEIVVSYRHPARPVPWDPRPQATDALGRTAHLGVITPEGRPMWLAHRIPHPIGEIAACGRHAALGYTAFDDDAVVAATAASWNGFGFTLAPELPGPSAVGCSDVDGDGVLEPVVIRSSR
jgi:hypothetical protein